MIEYLGWMIFYKNCNFKKGEIIVKKDITNLEKLIVLWTSSDKEVAENMVFMYAYNAKKKKWWEKVCLIIWGPSAKLLSEDVELQKYIVKMKDAGVKIEACKACSDSYGISSILEGFGIDVKYMGEPLTGYLKKGYKVITF